jgi:hypothetical protein
LVAQALDYATWAGALEAQELGRIHGRLSKGGDLGEAFSARVGQALVEHTLNESHQIVIVTTSLDTSSERIVAYQPSRHEP